MADTPESVSARFGKHLRNRLLSGVLVLVPLAVTILVLQLLFNSLTGFIRPPLRPLLPDVPESVLTAIAFVAGLLIVYGVGAITSLVVGRRLIRLGEAVLLKLPVVKSIYSASKQVVDTFSASNMRAFKSVVLVEFPRPGSLALGFVTGTMADGEGRELYRLFVPTTPNPTSGFLVIVPKDDVHFTDIGVEDGIKMIVSGGMLAPTQYNRVDAPPPQPPAPENR